MGIRILLICVLLRGACSAQVGIGGSILGYVFDPLNGVQPLLGIPGAATIAAPLDLPAGIKGITTSSQQNYALARTDSASELARIKLDTPASLGPLGVSIASTGLVALSPIGSAIAAYDLDRNRVIVFTGLPDSAAFARDFDIGPFAEAPISLAVNDTGEVALVSFSQSVIAIGADGSVTTLAGPRRGVAMKFLSRSRDAVIADSVSGSLYLVRDLPIASETRVLSDAIADPIAVAVSNDNKHVYVATSSGGDVTGFDLSTGLSQITPCFCQPTTLVSLNGNAVFRLTEPSGSPLWVFDGDSPEPRIVFVPPYRRAEESSQ